MSLLCCQAEEELRDKKAVFGELNADLNQSLPAFYTEYVIAASRLCISNIFLPGFCVIAVNVLFDHSCRRITMTTFIVHNLFRAEAKLYEELTKVCPFCLTILKRR